MSNKRAKFINDVGWRYETEHSMTRRMVNHDYQSRCIYMLTINLADRKSPLLGHLEWKKNQNPNINSPVKCSSAASCIYTPLGKKVANEWHALCKDYPQLEIIHLQLMPEHLHVVLFVKERIPKHLGKLVGIVKNRSNKHYWQHLTSIGQLGAKGTESPPSLFSENFQDTILSHSGQLDAMIKYTKDNPYRALIKRENRDLFEVVTQLNVNGMTFTALGNRWLLDRAVRMQVRCHNNKTTENLLQIERQKEYFLDRGKKGGVVVSPCISQGEKAIARAALDAGQPLIVILENGFPPLYKPPGKYFEACAKGLLLMLAPWPYHMEKRKITRSQCSILNTMAASISTEPWTMELETMVNKAAKQP